MAPGDTYSCLLPLSPDRMVSQVRIPRWWCVVRLPAEPQENSLLLRGRSPSLRSASPHLCFEVISFTRGASLPSQSAGPAFEVSHLFPHQAPERLESLSGSFGLSGAVPPCCDKQCSDSQATQHTPWWCFLKLNGQESLLPCHLQASTSGCGECAAALVGPSSSSLLRVATKRGVWRVGDLFGCFQYFLGTCPVSSSTF